ncbi:hypothetical protein F2Q69_00023692 [Brassica cretica]|uniref:Uncharacterized protein n=1 Tax=Brassica cretica TaxID=69181 RepID=A0A8S9Q4B3_BRACR|nr:hypothetical protein F2Q69_00023692 [Brassica cretica]
MNLSYQMHHKLKDDEWGLALIREPDSIRDPNRKSGYLEEPNPDPDSKMLDPSKHDPDPDILIFKSGYPDPESQKRGSQRLCSDYYDQDEEIRMLSDGRRDAGLTNWRGREKHFLEVG